MVASDGASERRASGLDMQRILDLNNIDGDDNNVTFTSHAINYLSSRLRFDRFCFNFLFLFSAVAAPCAIGGVGFDECGAH